MLKLAIFDLDGTLADSIYSIRDAVNMAMDKYGLPRRDYEQIRTAIGNGARELIRLSIPEDKRCDAEFVARVFHDYDRLYALTYDKVEGCYDGMFEAVHALRDSGCTVAVLSNKQDEYVKKIVDLLFPDGTVSFAAGQTELPKKPDPTVPLMIADMFGAAPCECAFIGDSDVDVRTGKNAGMMTVACTWGYRPREVLADADFLVDSAEELLSVLKVRKEK